MSDNFRQIPNIAETTQNALNAMGVTTFRQLAALPESQLATVKNVTTVEAAQIRGDAYILALVAGQYAT